MLFGIAQDIPAATKPEDCRYDACIAIPENLRITNDNKVTTSLLPGGKYAVFRITHTQEAVEKAWAEIFPELTRLRYEADFTRPILERYAVKLVQKQYCVICVPILQTVFTEQFFQNACLPSDSLLPSLQVRDSFRNSLLSELEWRLARMVFKDSAEVLRRSKPYFSVCGKVFIFSLHMVY